MHNTGDIISTNGTVAIVDYAPKYKETFRDLNEEWIRQYFIMEEADIRSLNHPEEYYLNKGGHILVALLDDKPVGVCALMKMDDPDYDYELSKMAVSPLARGKKIGLLLGQSVIQRAQKLGAKRVYLESNTILKPAISLYRKLGFKEITGRISPYQRANIQMSLDLA